MSKKREISPDHLRLVRSFPLFLALVWRHLNLPSPTPVQLDIAEYLQNGPKRRMVQAFRGVGKSWITGAYAVWRLWREYTLTGKVSMNVVVVSASKGRSDAQTAFMLRLIDEMPLLKPLKPKNSQRRSMVGFDVGPSTIAQTPSVVSIGITGQLTGHRADLVIPDDIETPGNSQTQHMREQLAEKVKEFDALLKPEGGEIVYLGTPQTEDSLYTHLRARGYEIRIWPARFPDEKRMAAYGDSLAPAIDVKVRKSRHLVNTTTEPTRFTDLDLSERELSYGAGGFDLQFMLDTRVSDADRYPLKLRDLITYNLMPDEAPERMIWNAQKVLEKIPNVGMAGDRIFEGYIPEQTQYRKYETKVMFIDPSGRGKDETGYCVLGLLHGYIFLLDSGGVPGYEDADLIKLCEIAKTYGVDRVVPEDDYGDGMFTKLLRPHLKTIFPVVIEEPPKQRQQKELRIIQTLKPLMQQHRLVVNQSLFQQDYDSTLHRAPEEQNRYRLFYQMSRVTSQRNCLIHDDRLDVLAMGCAYLSDRISKRVEDAVKRSKDKEIAANIRKFLRDPSGGLISASKEPRRKKRTMMGW